MANPDKPFGFKLVTSKGGNTALQKYSVDASNAAIIGLGDPISIEADGGVARSAADDGVIVVGVVARIEDSDGKAIKRLAASTAGTVYVIPAEGNVFEVQADSGTTLTAAAINATANFVVTGDADSTTGISQVELDSSDVGTGLQLRILGLAPGSSWAEHAKLLVAFNESVGYAGSASV